jgi:hypothetical protein
VKSPEQVIVLKFRTVKVQLLVWVESVVLLPSTGENQNEQVPPEELVKVSETTPAKTGKPPSERISKFPLYLSPALAATHAATAGRGRTRPAANRFNDKNATHLSFIIPPRFLYFKNTDSRFEYAGQIRRKKNQEARILRRLFLKQHNPNPSAAFLPNEHAWTQEACQ